VSLDDESYGVLAMVVIGFVSDHPDDELQCGGGRGADGAGRWAGGLADAAAVVIGTNVGTTTKAMLATIGATSNAKRLAAAHVLFNLLTGVVALLLLSPLLAVVLFIGDADGSCP
jgi:hypothetical protein